MADISPVSGQLKINMKGVELLKTMIYPDFKIHGELKFPGCEVRDWGIDHSFKQFDSFHIYFELPRNW